MVACEACIAENKVNPKKKINTATDKHHKFHNVQWARTLYKDLINHNENMQDACNQCNASHASVYLTHWNEIDFCRHFKIMPRSQEGIAIWKRLDPKDRWIIEAR